VRTLVNVLGAVDSLPAGCTRAPVRRLLVATRRSVAASAVEMTEVDAIFTMLAFETVRACTLVLERIELAQTCDQRLGNVMTRGAVQTRLGQASILEAYGAIAAQKARVTLAHIAVYQAALVSIWLQRLANAFGVL
jgi:hypothetical protein